MLEFASADPIAARALAAMYHAEPATLAAPTLRYGLHRSEDGAGYIATCPDRAPFGPAPLGDGWAYLEWRATEDLLQVAEPGLAFLHAGGATIGDRLLLLVGDSGAGKTTLAAHLALRGHRLIGDDMVQFATQEEAFSAVGRSLKLDRNSLSTMPLLAGICASARVGTLLAAESYYVSPAAFRRDWRAHSSAPWAVVLLDRDTHAGPARVTRSSEGEAAVYVTQQVLASGAGSRGARADDVTVPLLESLERAAAFRAEGGDPAALAALLEREALR